MQWFLNRLYDLAGWLAALAILAIFLLMMVQSVLRLAGHQVRGADDLTAWFCAASAFLGLATTFRRGEHVRVGLWLERLPPTVRRWLDFVCLTLSAVFVGWIFWAGARYIYGSYRMNEMAQGLLVIPVWIPQLSFLVGVGIFWVAIFEQWFKVLHGIKPDYQQAAEDRAARGEFDAV